MTHATPLRWARLLALATALMGATALAQPQGLPEVELERQTLNPSGQGSLLFGTGEVLPGGGYRLSRDTTRTIRSCSFRTGSGWARW
jgi:OmpA-OmpF porin, OOP family